MKIKARSFIVLFASVLIAVSAAWGFAQKKDQGDIEENKVVIDVSQIGKKSYPVYHRRSRWYTGYDFNNDRPTLDGFYG